LSCVRASRDRSFFSQGLNIMNVISSIVSLIGIMQDGISGYKCIDQDKKNNKGSMDFAVMVKRLKYFLD
jgi:hypothetical protein